MDTGSLNNALRLRHTPPELSSVTSSLGAHPHHLAHHLPHHHPHLPHHLHSHSAQTEFQPPYFPPPYSVTQSSTTPGGAHNPQQPQPQQQQQQQHQQLADYHHVHQTLGSESPYIHALNHYVLVCLNYSFLTSFSIFIYPFNLYDFKLERILFSKKRNLILPQIS